MLHVNVNVWNTVTEDVEIRIILKEFQFMIWHNVPDIIYQE